MRGSMRSIKEDFPGVGGAPIIHTQFLRGRSWRQSGMPRAKPIDRLVWHLLRSCECHRLLSIHEVARELWDDEVDNRNTARSSLKRLQSIGLAKQSGSLWMAIMPGPSSPLITKHMGKKIKPGGDNYHPKSSDVYHPRHGDNYHPQNSDNHHPIDSDKRHPRENLPSDNYHPKTVINVTPKQGRLSPPNSDNYHPIEIRDKREEETTTTTRDVGPSIEQLVSKARKVGVEEAISLYPRIFEEPVCLPTEELDYKRFMAVAIAIAVDRAIAKNEENGRKSSVPGLISSISKAYTTERWKAEEELDHYLVDQTKIKTAKARKARAAKSAEIPRNERFPTAPPFDPSLDDPEIKPVHWLRDRMPDLYQRVLEIECSDLEELIQKLQKVSRTATEVWNQTTNRTELRAIQQRNQFLSAIKPILRQFEARKVRA